MTATDNKYTKKSRGGQGRAWETWLARRVGFRSVVFIRRGCGRLGMIEVAEIGGVGNK
jgi:hypothetical protein